MFFDKKRYLLAVDAGGTKTVMAILDNEGDIAFKKIYQSSEIKNFTDSLLNFLNEHECKKYNVTQACIAAAGIVNKDRDFIRLTNVPWTIDKKTILVRTRLHRVILLNDFEAVGFAADTLKNGDYVELTNFGRRKEGTLALIGAGTGLGMSILYYDLGRHYPIPSEGGHADFPFDPKDEFDHKFLTFLTKKKRYNDMEDIVSGRGIVNIYEFLLAQKIKHSTKIQSEIKKAAPKEKPALITKYALTDKDALCMRTVELFIRYLARTSRNLALTSMCTELIISGGIPPKILPAMSELFVDEFTNHNLESQRKLLETVTVLVIVDPNMGLYGDYNVLKS